MIKEALSAFTWLFKWVAEQRENRTKDAQKAYIDWRVTYDSKKKDRARRSELIDSVELLTEKKKP